MSFSEFINHHDDYDYMIRTFYKDNIKSNLKINKIFIGPKKYNRNYSNYINVNEWDDVSLERDNSNILKINNQKIITEKFYEMIKTL
jgi:ribosomal protein L20